MLAVLALVGMALPGRAQSVETQSSASQPIAPATTQAAATPQSLEELEAAGTKISFDVASVKPNKAGGRSHSNISLTPGAAFYPTGGLFSATNLPLIAYLAFAYDVSGDQALRLLPQLPQWANSDYFDIEARAEGSPSKAEMQLMLQSLLTDRFKLAVRHETKEGPVYALVLAKAGKTGPELQAHVDDGACSQGAQPACGTGFSMMPPTVPGRIRAGARDITMAELAKVLPLTGIVGGADRPVLDRTGLRGKFDFSIEFAPVLMPGLGPPNFVPDQSAPDFLEALQEQLGLKLQPTAGPVDTIVIDHVERPMEN